MDKSKYHTHIGLFPDSFIEVINKPINNTTIELIEYSPTHYECSFVNTIQETSHIHKTPIMSWVNIIGLHLIEQFQHIYSIYKVHPIILENIIKSNQRPHIEDHNDYIYLNLNMIYNKTNDINNFISEQISIIIGNNYLLSFQEIEGDVFSNIRNKLNIPNGRVRNNNSDYLCYCLLEEIINNYSNILESIRERIELSQDYLIKQPHKILIEDLFNLKKDLLFLRKTIFPVYEIINNLIKYDNDLIKEDTKIYLRDLLVYSRNLNENIDNLNDNLMGLFDFYLTNKSNQLNEIMKVLTMFSVPFMPLSFLAGLYGMNFDYLPELKYHYSYPILVGSMIIIFLSLIIFFKRKKWF